VWDESRLAFPRIHVLSIGLKYGLLSLDIVIFNLMNLMSSSLHNRAKLVVEVVCLKIWGPGKRAN
jgi:hypothetical protein